MWTSQSKSDMAPTELRAHARRLFRRAEQMVPFPVDVEAFYMSMFPSAAHAWLESIGKDVSNSVEQANFMRLFSRDTKATLFLPSVVAGDSYVRLYFPQRMPIANAVLSMSLSVPRSHPDYDAVCKWYDAALLHDARLDNYERAIEACMDDMDLLSCWPNLCGVLKHKPRRKVSAAMVTRLHNAIDAPVQHEIDTFLASVTLLPDVRAPHAWVGLNETRGDT